MIVGLEGGVAAGKSTLRRGLGDLGHAGLKEYMDYVDNSIHPLISDWSILFKTQFFLQIERARKGSLEESQVFIDRTYLTLIAHDFARGDARRFSVGYERLYQRFLKHLIQPQKLVFLDAAHPARALRAAERGIPMAGYFTSPDFNAKLRMFFEQMSDFIPTLILDTDNLTPSQVLDRVVEFAKTDTKTAASGDVLNQALIVSRSL